ncbi:hypothetical protein FSP39_006376 [Pinctada imbricata]|uniref:MULE transposase domain-containing protein n=1 Tax=Pinctada imbricata TaxID=66713 RepID=A0AA89C0X0_PINIB|nr:hypothetical protein FSP39_006376 [Pinctada imbricata]
MNIFETPDVAKALDNIPPGLKENVFFLLHDKNKNDRQRSFPDDCGIWASDSGATPKSIFLKTNDGKYKLIFLRKGEYHFQKKVKGKMTYVKISPQPSPSKLTTLQRYYTSLKKDKTYKKRVTRLLNDDSCFTICEYIGKFPGLSSHGNTKIGETEYLRIPTNVMEEMSTLLKQKTPLEVYNDLTIKHDELSGPKNKQQVRDKKKNDKKKTKTHIGKNIADHMAEIDNLVTQNDSIVKSVIRSQGKSPCLILYNDEQIKDLKNICCTGQSILCVDKTFNLCDMHVTATCYKQVSVVDEKTNESPIFLGPMFIHDSSDFGTYASFFNHLGTLLANTDTSQLVIGSDEEVALVNAITHAFPNAQHILCTRHIKQNVNQKLTDDAVDKTDRDRIINLIFGVDGLVNADDTICFEEKSNMIEETCDQISSKFLNYYKKKVRNTIRTKVQQPQTILKLENWTNNNSESINHVLKHLANWKSQPLMDLVNAINTYVEAQFKDIRRALVGVGQFRLSKNYQHFEVSKTVWVGKTDQERLRYFNRCRNYNVKDKQIVTSTDGKTKIIAPRAHGKKIGQVKRKRNAKTTTVTKKQKL